MLLEGIFLPLTTPFRADGRLFAKKMESNVVRYSLTPAAGMLVLGSAGEQDALSEGEKADAFKSAMAAAGPEKVMIAGAGGGSVMAALLEAECAAKLGYDAVAVRAPEFAGDAAMRAEVMTYFQAIADGAALPVVLVSEGTRRLDARVIGEMAGHPRVIGLMDDVLTARRMEELKSVTAGVSREVTVTTVFAAATRRMLRDKPQDGVLPVLASGGLKTRTKKTGFQMLAGQVDGMLGAWVAGAAGAVPRLAVCAPQGCCEVWQAYRDGDLALAEEKQARVAAIGARMEGWKGVAALKYGCDVNGYFGGRLRLPLLSLTSEEQREIESRMAGLRT